VVVVVVVGLHVCKCEAGGGWGPKTKHDGSILGATCEMTVEGDGGRWWCGTNEVVVGPHI
jgi:hypothetical protein